MLKYNDFIIESAINESILYITSRLKNQLIKIGDDISKDILSVIGDDIKPDATFLDTDENDYIKFSTMRNFKKSVDDNLYTNSDFDKVFKKNIFDYIENSDKFFKIKSTSRNKLKIGRLVNQIFPNKYNSKQIEEFVNKFKSVGSETKNFELVSGDDIAYWYDSERYTDLRGSLGSSCMRNKSGIFDLYTKNENCQLLILKDGDKIKGRALVWKTKYIKISDKEYNDVYFIDRQYTVDDSDIYLFREYAEKNDWFIKARNNYSSMQSVMFKNIEYGNADMCVEAPKEKLEKFPYLDTFRVYDPNEYEMFNIDTDDTGEEDYVGFYNLDVTDGSFTKISNRIYSEYYDTMISNEDAVYSDYYESYINRSDAVYVGGDWYPDDCDAITYCSYKNQSFLADDCVWSEYDSEYYLIDDVVSFISDINTSTFDVGEDMYKEHDDVRNLESIEFSIECIERMEIEVDYILEEFVTNINDARYESKTTAKCFAINLYKVKGEEKLYLPKLIANNFKLDIDEEVFYLSDMFFFCKENEEGNYNISLNDISEFDTEDDLISRLKDVIEYYIN